MTSTENETERREFGSLRLRGRIWWLRYRIDRKEHWESSRSTSKNVAAKLLLRRQAELGAGVLVAPDTRRVMFSDLETMLRTHYQTKGRRSLPRVERALNHLRATFGTTRAHVITADSISAYEGTRLGAGAARATVNYELAMLRKAFNIAVGHRRLSSAPAISISVAKNARTGFFEPDDFRRVVAELPESLKPVMRFAYLTGWRVPSEVLPLTWDRVDFVAGEIRLDRNTTKTDEPRIFPFKGLPELAALLESQRARTRAVERETSSIVPYVFHHRHGKRIRSYANGWRAACERAAHDGKGALRFLARAHLLTRIPHDFRRTAVRNLVRAGVADGTAMKLTGHETREIFERYNIVSGADLRAGVEKLAAHLAQTPETSRKGTKGVQTRRNRAASGAQ